MKIEILHEAEEELNEAVAYYEEIESGLGVRLKEEARTIIRWIGDNPEIPRLRPKGYRLAREIECTTFTFCYPKRTVSFTPDARAICANAFSNTMMAESHQPKIDDHLC